MLIAQNFNYIQSQGLPGNTIPGSVGDIIGAILPYVFYGAGIALLIYLVMGGLQLMLSRGEPKAVQAAQAKITNALIGFIVVAFAFAIVSILGNIFGITVFGHIFIGHIFI